MSNSPDIAFVKTAEKIGQIKAQGVDFTRQHEVTHQFFSFHENREFRKALEELGFKVSERDESPGLEARRPEHLSVAALRSTVEQLCRIADRYAAEYDGWDLTANLNQKLEEK